MSGASCFLLLYGATRLLRAGNLGQFCDIIPRVPVANHWNSPAAVAGDSVVSAIVGCWKSKKDTTYANDSITSKIIVFLCAV